MVTSIKPTTAAKARCCVCGMVAICRHFDNEMKETGSVWVCSPCAPALRIADVMLNYPKNGVAMGICRPEN